MKTPEEFYADAGLDPNAMTETALVIAMMQQYAEYYHKNLVTDVLCAFFKFFRDNGEANIGMTIETFVDAFLANYTR